MRVFWFFFLFIGVGIGLPMVLGLWARFNKQPATTFDSNLLKVSGGRFEHEAEMFGADTVVPPREARDAFVGADAAAVAMYRDLTRVNLIHHTGEQAGNQIVSSYFMPMSNGKSTIVPGGWTMKLSTGESAFIARTDDTIIFVAGPDEASTKARFDKLPFVKANTTRTIGNKLDEEWKRPMIGALAVWVLIISFGFIRLASWAGTVEAKEGVPIATGPNLKDKLLAINQQDVPFSVREGESKDELIVDWRYADAKWVDPMRAHGMKKGYRLKLRLDPDEKRVRAGEYYSSLDWSAGVSDASLQWKMSREITFFHYQYEKVYGLQIKNGQLTLDPSYEYTFNLQELKNPVINAIVESGWEYKPVLIWWRWLGG